MTKINTISNTAFYCCGIRMDDSMRKRSVCNDHYAKRFMDERGLEIYEPFKTEIMPNISNITRCRIIDDVLRNEIRENANTIVITIGAGFDTRPYRIRGAQWIELDEARIIDYKNEKLAINECKNNLERISIDFSSESLLDKLRTGYTDKHIIIVIEGVFMYLEPDAIRKTIRELQTLFHKHVLFCDLMNKIFFDKYTQSIHSKLVSAGGTFTKRPERPEEIFINNNYVHINCIPMVKRATELGIYWDVIKMPRFVANILFGIFMKDLYGYTVNQFQYG